MAIILLQFHCHHPCEIICIIFRLALSSFFLYSPASSRNIQHSYLACVYFSTFHYKQKSRREEKHSCKVELSAFICVTRVHVWVISCITRHNDEGDVAFYDKNVGKSRGIQQISYLPSTMCPGSLVTKQLKVNKSKKLPTVQ